MRESVFCLMPGGDGITRNAFYQSLLMGCIPVVFRSDPVYFAQYAFSRVIPYADMVHHVPERAVLSGLDVVQELRSAREDVIRAKQALIANWSHLLTFRQSALSETLSELQGMRGGAAAPGDVDPSTSLSGSTQPRGVLLPIQVCYARQRSRCII